MTLDTPQDAAPRLNGGQHPRSALIDAVGVTVETYLGSAPMTVAELSSLTQGDLVTLDASLNTLVELRVNGVAIAHGELVASGDKFAVRITTLAP